MKIHPSLLVVLFIIFDLFLIERILVGSSTISIFDPKGIIALQERNLIFVIVFLMLLVVIPVFLLMIHVVRKYHANNTHTDYHPDWDHNTKLQLFIWGFPFLIVCAMAGITWEYAHQLDPHKAIATSVKPMTVQVVALRWKWLFIYPEQKVATLNYLVIPNNTPVHFELTAYEAPMNSFWIPQLGGQIYAMSGMSTQTYLMATQTGVYRGSNAEISGHGFADMIFTTKVMNNSDFNAWINSTKQSSQQLTMADIEKLAKPTEDHRTADYSSTEQNLYTTIVMKYMAHSSTPSEQNHTETQTDTHMENMPGM